MSEQSQAAPTSAATEGASDAPIQSYDQRIAQVTADLKAAQQADAATEEQAAPEGQASADAPTEAEETPSGVDPRAERRARLDALAQKERTRVDATQQATRLAQLERELAAERAKLDQYKTRDGWVDPTSLDEARFFELAAQAKVDPKRLGEWLTATTTSPERLAAEVAKKTIDPEIAALKAKLEEQQRLIESATQALAQRSEAEQLTQMQQSFASHVTGVAQRAPLTANLLKAAGVDALWRIADKVATKVPAGAGADALVDAIEEHLDGPVRAETLQAAQFYGLVQPEQKAKTSTPPTQKPRRSEGSVPNSLAQQRASVVDDEEEWASIPLEERAARLKRSG